MFISFFLKGLASNRFCRVLVQDIQEISKYVSQVSRIPVSQLRLIMNNNKQIRHLDEIIDHSTIEIRLKLCGGGCVATKQTRKSALIFMNKPSKGDTADLQYNNCENGQIILELTDPKLLNSQYQYRYTQSYVNMAMSNNKVTQETRLKIKLSGVATLEADSLVNFLCKVDYGTYQYIYKQNDVNKSESSQNLIGTFRAQVEPGGVKFLGGKISSQKKQSVEIINTRFKHILLQKF